MNFAAMASSNLRAGGSGSRDLRAGPAAEMAPSVPVVTRVAFRAPSDSLHPHLARLPKRTVADLCANPSLGQAIAETVHTVLGVPVYCSPSVDLRAPYVHVVSVSLDRVHYSSQFITMTAANAWSCPQVSGGSSAPRDRPESRRLSDPSNQMRLRQLADNLDWFETPQASIEKMVRFPYNDGARWPLVLSAVLPLWWGMPNEATATTPTRPVCCCGRRWIPMRGRGSGGTPSVIRC